MGLLSWLSGGRRAAAADAPAPSAGPPPAEPAPAPARPAAPAWRELPPVQRAVPGAPLLTDPDGFRGSLSAWQDSSFHRPLGHLVSPQAPSGLVHGLLSTADPDPDPAAGRRTDGPDNGPAAGPGPTVSRQADGTAAAERQLTAVWPRGGTRSGAPVAVQRTASPSLVAAPRPETPPSALHHLPVTGLLDPPAAPPPTSGDGPGADGDVPASGPTGPLTGHQVVQRTLDPAGTGADPVATDPAPVAQRLADAGSAPAAPDPGPRTPAPPAVWERPVPEDGPPPDRTAPDLLPPAPAGQGPDAAGPKPVPAGPEPATEGAEPAASGVEAMPETSAAEEVRPIAVPLQRVLDTDGPLPDAAGGTGAGPSGPVPPPVRWAETGDRAPVPPERAAPGRPAAPVQRTADTGRPERGTVQRTVDPDGPGPGPARPAPAGHGSGPARRFTDTGPAEQPPVQRRLDPGGGGPVPVQRSTEPGGGPAPTRQPADPTNSAPEPAGTAGPAPTPADPGPPVWQPVDPDGPEPVQRSVEPPGGTVTPAPDTPRRPLLGLGEPLTALPPTAQRTPAAATGPATRYFPTPDAPRDADLNVPDSGRGPDVTVLPGGGRGPDVPAPVAQRWPSDTGDSPGVPPTAAPPDAGAEPGTRAAPAMVPEPGPDAGTGPDTPTGPDSGPESDTGTDGGERPLLGDDPLTPHTAVESPGGPTGPEASRPAPVAQRLPETGGAPQPPGSTTPRAPAGGPSRSAPVPVQPLRADGTPAAGPGPGRSGSAGVTAPVVPLVAQRSVPLYSGVRPPQDGPSGRFTSESPVVPVRWSTTTVPEAGSVADRDAVQRSVAPTGPGRTPAPGPGPGAPPHPPPGVSGAAGQVVQRSAAPAAVRDTGVAAGPFPAPAGVPAAAVPLGPGAPVPLQRTAFPASGRSASAAVPPGPSASVASPAALGPAAVPRAAAGPGSVPGVIDAGAVAVAAGVAQRLADGSVVFRPPPGAPAAVQRDADAGGPAGGPPPDPPSDAPGEPAPEPAPGPDVAPDAAPESAGAEGDGGGTAPESGQAGGGKGPGGKGGAPAVTDELVRALYPPLSRMLKADLRLERERAGFLIDTRH